MKNWNKNQPVALYLWVANNQNHSELENQIKALEDGCHAMEFNRRLYVDKTPIGAFRSELDRLRQDVRNGGLSKVIVLSLSRLAQSRQELLDIVAELRLYKVHWVSLCENIKTDTNTGKATQNALMEIAQMENDILAFSRGEIWSDEDQNVSTELICKLLKYKIPAQKISEILVCEPKDLAKAKERLETERLEQEKRHQLVYSMLEGAISHDSGPDQEASYE
ncbi:MAG: recombinase family protein [Bdellovibrionota bacterium]|nr:recombinase family protein [Bdellovibrionota bacterium]